MADYDWTPEYYYAQQEDGKPSPFQERGFDFETFMQKTAQQNEEGLPVKLEVPELNWRRINRWDLLMIYTKPKPGFAHRSNWAKQAKLTHEGYRYHISLCFVKEVPEGGWEAYESIRKRYDGREGVLNIKVWNAQAELIPGFNALTDEILNDPDIQLLHSAGDYKTRPLHVST